MVRVLLLLLGTRYIRKRWPLHAALGIALAVVGIGLVIDALDGVLYFPLRYFGIVLLAEGCVMMFTASSTSGIRRRLLFGRGVIVTIAAGLVAIGGDTADLLTSLVFGLALALDGLLRVGSAWLVRFYRWEVSLMGGVAEIAIAALVLDPHFLHYHDTVPFVTGIAIFLAGWGLVRLALYLRALPGDALLPTLFSRGWHPVEEPAESMWSKDGSPETLTIHVWTADGTAEAEVVSNPLLNRYIVAIDRRGVVSTGHTACELPGHFYASHYPAVDIDRSTADLSNLLRATADNNVPGVFQASYAQESADWCESTWKVQFPEFNFARVMIWWASYSRDSTYNLTNRSCSTTTAHLLETALEGVVGNRNPSRLDVARILFSPELWLAGQFREKAENLAWTPGLVLDYARALSGALSPPHLPTMALARIVARAIRGPRRR